MGFLTTTNYNFKMMLSYTAASSETAASSDYGIIAIGVSLFSQFRKKAISQKSIEKEIKNVILRPFLPDPSVVEKTNKTVEESARMEDLIKQMEDIHLLKQIEAATLNLLKKYNLNELKHMRDLLSKPDLSDAERKILELAMIQSQGR